MRRPLGEDIAAVSRSGTRIGLVRVMAVGVVALALALVGLRIWGGGHSSLYAECATLGFPSIGEPGRNLGPWASLPPGTTAVPGTWYFGLDSSPMPGQVETSDEAKYWWVYNGQHGAAYYRGGRCPTP